MTIDCKIVLSYKEAGKINSVEQLQRSVFDLDSGFKESLSFFIVYRSKKIQLEHGDFIHADNYEEMASRQSFPEHTPKAFSSRRTKYKYYPTLI